MNYITADTICAMIARNNKTLTFDKYDVVEWCAEAEKKIGDYYGFQEITERVQVVNNRCLLPCNVYRLLSVCGDNGCDMPYEKKGECILFNKTDFYIRIKYLGIPLDENGFPYIKDNHDQACYFYCLTKLYFEDYLNGKIDGQRYGLIMQRYGEEVSKAKGSIRDLSRNDMNEILKVMYHIVRRNRIPSNI